MAFTVVASRTEAHEAAFVLTRRAGLHSDLINPAQLEGVIRILQQEYACIVIDLPSQVVDSYHQFFAERSDTLYVVSNIDIPNIARVRQYLDLAQEHLDPAKIRLLVNRSTLQGASGVNNKTMEEGFYHPVSHRFNDDWSTVLEAISLGKFLSEVSERSALAKQLRAFSGDLMGQPPAADEATQWDLLGGLKKLNTVMKGGKHVHTEARAGI